MFKKQLADLKTSAPLKNSDRRKLRQRVLQDYVGSAENNTEIGDLLVPEGIHSVKFITHGEEPGLAYTSADGEPLWFTLGKGSNDLIPTVYTLWKSPRLLPHLSTPSTVIPILQNGADLMAAGVVEMLGNPAEGHLVSITCYAQGAVGVGPPLAVGRMAMSGERVREKDAKGKAVKVLHVYKDKLWEMGGKNEPPEPVPVSATSEADVDTGSGGGEDGKKGDLKEDERKKGEEATPSPSPPEATGEENVASPPPDAQVVSTILRTSLIQAIRTSLRALPQASFPLPSTVLYTNHILPSRPAHVVSFSSLASASSKTTMMARATTAARTPIDIKHSTFKNLTAFLKSAEKEGLIRIKELRAKGSGAGGGGTEVQILSVNAEHPDVQAHRVYRTVGEEEAKREKREERERGDRERGEKNKEIGVTQLWKPHLQSVRLFVEIGKDTTSLYDHQQLKEITNAYIESRSLVNANQRQFINIDDLLRDVLTTAAASKRSEAPTSTSTPPEFMKREELVKRLTEKMQPWRRIEVEGKDPVLKKGKLHPIQISTKLRQGRKACTFITNFEPYLLDANDLAEELRRLCASSTAVSSALPGSNAGMEVMVQGKQIKAIKDLLMSKGVPKAWIEESDLIGGGKKK